ARSTPPGVTGFVRHQRLCNVPNSRDFWLGDAVDGEPDGKVSTNPPGGAPRACDTTDATDCNGHPFGWSFGQDQRAGDAEAGVQPIQSPLCAEASLSLTITNCQPKYVLAYLNVLVDWNHDGDWNDHLACAPFPPVALFCSYEWAVKNEQLVLAPGKVVLNSPSFTAHSYEQNKATGGRSEEHTSELQSLTNLVCRLLL